MTLEHWQIVLNASVLLVLLIGGLFLRKYLPSYLDQKAKNLATKEDVAAITAEIQQVKARYSERLEAIRAALGSQLYIHQVRYEKEFEIFTELTTGLVELRDAARGLRPTADRINLDESEDDRRRRRIKRFDDASIAFYKTYESKQAFFPEEIYGVLVELHNVAWREASQFARSTDRDEREPDRAQKFFDPKYWDKAEANSERIADFANGALDLVRKRVRRWETLDFAEIHVPDA